MSPVFGATAWTVDVVTSAAAATVAGALGSGELGNLAVDVLATGVSLYICLQMEDNDERPSRFVSNANRTRMTSRGYVKKTEVTPARPPLTSRLSGVSYSFLGMRADRICS